MKTIKYIFLRMSFIIIISIIIVIIRELFSDISNSAMWLLGWLSAIGYSICFWNVKDKDQLF